MSTIQQQATSVPSGFNSVQMPYVEGEPETFTSYQGPATGHVWTHWNEGFGITVALEGLGVSGRDGMALTPGQARILAAQLHEVVTALDALEQHEDGR